MKFFSLSLCLLLCHWFQSVSSQNASKSNNLQQATIPPRGWNSYDSFSWVISEQEFLQSAEIVSQKLHDHGYEYVVVDYLWYRMKVPGASHYSIGYDVIDEWGRMVPDPGRWPSSKDGKGFTEIADKVHSLGLKFGIHVMRGISTQAVNANTPILDITKGGTYEESGRVWRAKDIAIPERACAWMPDGFMSVNTNLGAGKAFLRSLYVQYAAWGVDFVKHDCVFGDDLDLNEITYVSELLREFDRPILYSLSPGTSVTPAMAKEVSGLVNLYRITGDDWDNWGDVKAHFDVSRDFSTANMIGAKGLKGNSWPDLDMLPFGWLTDPGSNQGPHRNTNLNLVEKTTQFPYITSLKSEDPLWSPIRRSNKEMKTSYTHSLSFTSCAESKASGWSSDNIGQYVERVCWKRSLGNKNLDPFCVHKRGIRFTLHLESMFQKNHRGEHHLVSTDNDKFCLDASPRRKLTSQESRRGSFSPCRWDSNQMWQLNSNGTLVNSYSGQCATIKVTKATTNVGGFRSWIATGRKGEVYVAFFNLSEQENVISAQISDLTKVLPGRDFNSCEANEVSSGDDISTTHGTLSATVTMHGSALFVLNCN
ncbi:hypothetical protein Lal_00021985 [Lupinus albus]|nr:hypothetical protein Lal_00021985 [Lupinus albus]